MPTQPLLDLLKTRRSVRRFLPRHVSEAVLKRVLETATWSPSAHNRQPWRFAVLDSRNARERLAEKMGSEFHRDLIKDGLSPIKADDLVKRSYNRIVEAPAAVLLCCDFSEMDSYPDEKRQQAERLMAVQSTAMSGFLLLLAAHAEGLGGVWVCGPLFAPQAAASALDLPDEWIPQGLLLLGYPAVTPEPRARLPLKEVARFM